MEQREISADRMTQEDVFTMSECGYDLIEIAKESIDVVTGAST